MPLPSIGGGSFIPGRGIIIRLILHGHANRPFFHIGVLSQFAKVGSQPVEQLGTYDPMPNQDNQKLLSLNVERTRYWMGQGAQFTPPVAELLGKAGFLPIHSRTYAKAWRYRCKVAEDEAQKSLEGESSKTAQPPSSSSSS